MPPSHERLFSILVVCRSYPPVVGGSEIEAQRVCSALLRRGHHVTVLCAGGPPMPEASSWVDPEGVPVRAFGRHWPERLRDYAFACGVAWTLWTERPGYQIVYFLMQGIHLAVGLPVAHWLGKPMVMKVSGSGVITLMRNSWLGRTELRWLRKWARRVMILNPAMADEACAAGFSPQHLLWMPNPVAIDIFAPLVAARRREVRASLGISPETLVVVYVGRLAPEKELSSLVEAIPIVARTVSAVVLLLVGDGPARAALEKQAAGLCPAGTVRFAGKQTIPEVLQWLQISDVFALVSSLEGLPVSLLEAMSVGLPSVVSDIPANLQLIDAGVHGLHARLRDPESIAACLVELLLDAPRRVRLGEAARRRVVENYSVDKVIDRYEALFAEAVEDRHASA